MSSDALRERLQPSLFDRLDDAMAPIVSQLEEDRAALDRMLDPTQRAALARLLKDERLAGGRIALEPSGAFVPLGVEARALLDRFLELEGARRLEARRRAALSAAELRRAVLRDLHTLLNATAVAARADESEDGLARFPAVRASVVNYGIPALAGHVRTFDDFLELAQRIERAIQCFEPRLRHVRVRPNEGVSPGAGQLTSPLDVVIEAELWGYPVAEHLLVHTFLDLDVGHVEVGGLEQAA